MTAPLFTLCIICTISAIAAVVLIAACMRSSQLTVKEG